MRILEINLALFLVFLPALFQAQSIVQPEEITIEDGLSQGFISCLLQDREGFIWLGTKNGLNRYDGERIEVFTHEPTDAYTISHDWASKLLEFGDYILVGTTGGGLNLFHKKNKKFYKIPPTNPGLKSWTTMDIRSISVDTLGQIWVLEAHTGVLARLQFPEHFWERLPLEEILLQEVVITTFPNLEINSIGYDENYIYGGVFPNKMLRIDIHSDEPEWLQNQPPTKSPMGIFDHDTNEGFFVNTYNEDSILYFDKGTWDVIKTDFQTNDFFYFENEKELWIISGNEILLFEDWIPNEQTLFRSNAQVIISELSNGCRQLIKDRSGIIWAGTGGYGLLKIHPRLLSIKTYFEKISVSAPPFMTSARDIIVSTIQGPLLNTKSSSSPSLPFRSFWFENQDGTKWLVGKHLMRVKAQLVDENWQSQKNITLGEETYGYATAIRDKKKNAIWVASPLGFLFHFNTSSDQLKSYSFQHLFHNVYDCYSMTTTPDGLWWIGTSRGLIKGTPLDEGFDFELIEANNGNIDGLLNNDVASLLNDPNDPQVLWIGTKGGGVHRLDTRTMKFTHLNSKNGLPNDVIYGILADENGNFWMSSNQGIISYNPTTGEIQNFTEEDGMQSNEFNTWAYAKASTGELMFGGVNGLNVFHPDDLKKNPNVPKVWITSLSVNNQPVFVGDSTGILEQSMEHTSEITLPFSQNSLSLEFVALEFSAPFKNRFRYYLEGAEKEWIHEDTDNKANYLSLSPGSYTFKVKGSNGDGVWNEQPTELKITILPPWYRTTLAYFIYVVLLGWAIWYFQKFRENRLLLKLQVEHEQKEAERLKELDQAKSRLYTNITHEFRTPLTVISGIAEQMKKDTLEEDKIVVKRNSDQLLNLVNQMLDLRKLESGVMTIQKTQSDIVKFLRYLTESLKSYAEMKGLSIHFLSNEKSLLMDFDKEKITRIHANLLSNTIKFTPEGGNVYVQILTDQPHKSSIDNNHFTLMVKDTGVGIPEEKLPHIFDRFYQVDDSSTRRGEGTGIGLTLVAELIKAMGGEISAKSSQGEGTTFTITLPITNVAKIEEVAAFENFSNASIVDQSALITAAPSLDYQNLSSHPVALIVEDNADVIHYLITCLKENYSIEIAMNGEEGIEKAIEYIPDIIISDVMMPVKDGFELCQTLKTDERTSHIPIILLTAKSDIESRLKGLQKGADAYLSKPFHQQELLIILNSQLELRKKLQVRFSHFADSQAIQAATSAVAQNEMEINLELEDAFLKKIKDLVEKDLSDTDFGMPQLIRGLGMSRSQIYKKVKALTGHSPSVFIQSIRLKNGKKLLETTDLNISEIAYEVGFSSPAYFSKLFLEKFGSPPSETRK